MKKGGQSIILSFSPQNEDHGVEIYILDILNWQVLTPFQIVSYFSFSKYIAFDTYLHRYRCIVKTIYI